MSAATLGAHDPAMTYIDNDTVEAALALSFANISQPISENCDEH